MLRLKPQAVLVAVKVNSSSLETVSHRSGGVPAQLLPVIPEQAYVMQGLFGDTLGLEPHAILPTVGLNVGRLEAFQAQLLLWDLGGAPGLRSIWDKYYADSHALLFVVDASQPERCTQVRGVCWMALLMHRSQQLSLAIAAFEKRASCWYLVDLGVAGQASSAGPARVACSATGPALSYTCSC